MVKTLELAKEGVKCLYKGGVCGNAIYDLHAITNLASSILIADAIRESHFHIAKPNFTPEYLVGVDMGDVEDFTHDFEVKGKA